MYLELYDKVGATCKGRKYRDLLIMNRLFPLCNSHRNSSKLLASGKYCGRNNYWGHIGYVWEGSNWSVAILSCKCRHVIVQVKIKTIKWTIEHCICNNTMYLQNANTNNIYMHGQVRSQGAAHHSLWPNGPLFAIWKRAKKFLGAGQMIHFFATKWTKIDFFYGGKGGGAVRATKKNTFWAERSTFWCIRTLPNWILATGLHMTFLNGQKCGLYTMLQFNCKLHNY